MESSDMYYDESINLIGHGKYLVNLNPINMTLEYYHTTDCYFDKIYIPLDHDYL